VQTARIEKQQTGKTDNGENDIVYVAQSIVAGMFGLDIEIPAFVADNPIGKPLSEQKSESKPSVSKGDPLVVRGTSIFSNEQKLNRMELNNLFANTAAAQLYDKGVSRRKTGKILYWTGISLTAVSVLNVVIATAVDGETDVINTAIVLGSGIGCLGVSIPFNLSGKNYIHNAVNSYNACQYTSSHTPELKFGLTQNGVGFVLNF
jgi:hypothetical protein